MTNKVSIGAAWSEAAAFVRRENKLLAPLVLALMVVPATVSQLLQPSNPLAGPGGFEPWMAVSMLALLAGLIGQMAVSRLALGGAGSLGDTLGLALKRLPTTLGAVLIFFLCVALVMIPTIVVVMLAGGTRGASALGNFVTLLALFAAAPRIILAPAISMTRQLGPWSLVKETWRASRGQYWRLLGFFMLFLMASLVVAMAAASVIGTVVTLVIGPPVPMSVSRLIVALFGGLLQGVIATVYAAMIGRIVARLPAPVSSAT